MNLCSTFKTSLLFLVISLALISCQSLSESRNLEKQILDELLDKTKYDSRIAPTNKHPNGTDSPAIVTINFYLRQVEYVCTKEMEWKTQLTFRHQWNDPRLQFNDRNGRVAYLTLEDISRVWTPDTFISNSKTTEQNNDLRPNLLVRIYPNGNILFSIRITTTLGCPMDLIHYPFDTQTCYIQFASYGYTTDDIILSWKEGDPIQVTKMLNIPDMTLIGYNTSYCTSRTNTGEYSCLKAAFQFERESHKYVCRWLLPTAVLTLIAFASFWIKPKKCCRVKLLAITLILLYLHIVYINNKESPQVSYSTAKDCWLSTCLLFVVMAFVEYGIVAILDRLNKQRNRELKRSQNGKSCDPEGDAVVLKPLVDEEKANNADNNKQYTVNEQCSHQSFAQKWRRAPLSGRIDLISAILFPLLFIIYVITFVIYQSVV